MTIERLIAKWVHSAKQKTTSAEKIYTTLSYVKIRSNPATALMAEISAKITILCAFHAHRRIKSKLPNQINYI